ncbi:MAG: HAMP domain-containing sensor histidine kinase [Kiritimatiellia bacterium]
MPDENLEHIYSPFFTSKPRGQGTGLGLSTCRKIVDQHAGDIMYSRNPRGGSVFSIRLPKFSPPPEHTNPF